MKPPWTHPEWFDQVSDWIHSELSLHNRKVIGPIERVHLRPWSIVLRVPTLAGDLYFKASAEVLAHEAVVTQALSRRQPDYLPTVFAANLKHGWMLMSDGGVTLRQVIKADRDLRHWARLLPIYAELQIELAKHLPDLLALGLPDRTLATLPNQFQQLLDQKEILYIDQSGGLTSEEHRRLRGLGPQFAALCQRIAANPIPESIHHGDFHDGNIFTQDGRFVFFDWGDSSAAHPFFSLRTAFVSLENTLNYAEDASEFDVLREAYLEPWTKYDSWKGLYATLELTQCVSPVVSSLGWYRVVSALEEPSRGSYAEAVPSLLKEFLSYWEKL